MGSEFSDKSQTSVVVWGRLGSVLHVGRSLSCCELARAPGCSVGGQRWAGVRRGGSWRKQSGWEHRHSRVPASQPSVLAVSATRAGLRGRLLRWGPLEAPQAALGGARAPPASTCCVDTAQSRPAQRLALVQGHGPESTPKDLFAKPVVLESYEAHTPSTPDSRLTLMALRGGDHRHPH